MVYRIAGMLFILIGCLLSLGQLLWGGGPSGGFRGHDSGTSDLVTGVALLAAGLYLCFKRSSKKA